VAEERPDELRTEVCEAEDRAPEEDRPEERRDWADAPGAAIIAIVMKRAAAVLIILLMALSFKSVIDISNTFWKVS